MASDVFDIVIIGGGPGGYVCAIRCAQLGFKTALVEVRERLGGTCLNVGCIPSKTLLDISEKYYETSHLEDFGITVGSVKADIKKIIARKESVIDTLAKGIDGLFKKNKITRFAGFGSITKEGKVLVKENSGSEKLIDAKNIIIATGSDVAKVPGVEIDEKRIVSSTGALELNEVPKKMIVIGGGYIGLELGSVWKRLGSEVTVVEYLDKIVPAMDEEVSKQFQKILEKQGFKFMLGTKVVSAKAGAKDVSLEVSPAKGGTSEKLNADIVLVSVGRKPYTDGLGLKEAGVELDDRGRVQVDESYRTNVSHIYAIGDVIAGPMLAHKAEEEGIAVAEIIAGEAGHVNYDAIPGVVYTWPEVASVGKTEQELKDGEIAYKVGKFPFMANSRARAVGETEGFVKVLACAETDKILGAHIIGPDAGTMIAEFVLALEYYVASEDIARTSHAHPTLNEAVREACLAVLGRAIHI